MLTQNFKVFIVFSKEKKQDMSVKLKQQRDT